MGKTCNKCGRELSLDNFCNDKSRKDGLAGKCKDCNREYGKVYRKINPEKVKAKNKKWREANPEQVKATIRAWREANTEKDNAAHRAWRDANPEKAKFYTSAWRETNLEKVKATHKAWCEANSERVRVTAKAWYEANTEKRKAWCEANTEKTSQYTHRRKAIKRSLLSTLTVTQWEEIKQHFNNACCYCGEGKPLHQEHFLALSKGGEYSRDNILPACGSCNSSKGSKIFLEWYPRYRHYSKKREKAILDFLNYKNNTQQLSISL